MKTIRIEMNSDCANACAVGSIVAGIVMLIIGAVWIMDNNDTERHRLAFENGYEKGTLQGTSYDHWVKTLY